MMQSTTRSKHTRFLLIFIVYMHQLYSVGTAQSSSYIFQHRMTGGPSPTPRGGDCVRAVIEKDQPTGSGEAIYLSEYDVVPVYDRLCKQDFWQAGYDDAYSIYGLSGKYDKRHKLVSGQFALRTIQMNSGLPVGGHRSLRSPLRDLPASVLGITKEHNVYSKVQLEYMLYTYHNRYSWMHYCKNARNTLQFFSFETNNGRGASDQFIFVFAHMFVLHQILYFCNNSVNNVKCYYNYIIFIYTYSYGTMSDGIYCMYEMKIGIPPVCLFSQSPHGMTQLSHDPFLLSGYLILGTISESLNCIRTGLLSLISRYRDNYSFFQTTQYVMRCEVFLLHQVLSWFAIVQIYMISVKHSILMTYRNYVCNTENELKHNISKAYASYRYNSDKVYKSSSILLLLSTVYVFSYDYKYKNTWE